MIDATNTSEIRTRSIAGLALTTAALFLALVALLIGAPALFYMGTALFTMIGACQFQAWLSVKGLRFARVAPETARVGDLVTVEITVWSDKKVRRPLVSIIDNLPKRLILSHRSPSLPIAPAFDLPIRTQYQFRALKRGRYRWSGLVVEGTDALGLVSKHREYDTAATEMTVLPRPIPVSVELPNAAGWGISEAESGHHRGAGLEPRGIRNYVPGDPLRHIHWRSTAKTGQLLVKEFEAGAQAAAAFVIQRTQGTDIGEGYVTSLEAMVGHTVFLAESFLRQGARIEFPGLEEHPTHFAPHERVEEIYQLLAAVQADQTNSLAADALRTQGTLPMGSVLFLLVGVQDPDLPEAVAALHSRGVQVVTLLYDTDAFVAGRERKKAGVPQVASLPYALKGLLPGRSGKAMGTSQIPSAVNATYVEALRAAGATPIVMPTEVRLESQ